MWEILHNGLYVIGALAFVYVAMRLSSIAHFRSKAEYDRSRNRGHLNGENNAED